MVYQLSVHTIYAPQSPLKEPEFQYKANICLHLLQSLAKNMIGGFALVQIDLKYLYQIYGLAVPESVLVPPKPNINQAVWEVDSVLPQPQVFHRMLANTHGKKCVCGPLCL